MYLIKLINNSLNVKEMYNFTHHITLCGNLNPTLFMVRSEMGKGSSLLYGQRLEIQFYRTFKNTDDFSLSEETIAGME